MKSSCGNFGSRSAAIKSGCWALSLIELQLLLLLPGVLAQPARLSVAYTGAGPTHLPVWIAKETGIFARNGLDVQIVRAQAAVATMSLISGEVGFIQAAAPAVVLSNLSGSGSGLCRQRVCRYRLLACQLAQD